MTKYNENKVGYKETKLGWLPAEWKVAKLGSCCINKGDYGINAPAVPFSKDLPTYLRITDIDDDGNYVKSKKVSVKNENSDEFILKEGDIVFARTGATVGKSYLFDANDGKLVFAGFLIKFTPNNKTLMSMYLKHAVSTQQYWHWVKTTSMRSGQPGINAEEFRSLPISLPPLSEQQVIAFCLSTWDTAINKIQKLIEQKKFYNKWFANQLLTGRKRFPQFIKTKNRIKTKVGELPEDWDIKYISNVVKRIRNSFSPNPNEIYQEIGIRSHTKGIFYKEPVTGKSLGNKSVFWIEPECFVVNIVFAWEHAIAKTTEKEKGMIASHRFPMYKPKVGVLDLDYLLYFFKSKRGKHLLGLASPGGAGRNKTLGQSEFIKLQIPVSCIEEQRAIANAISAADRELFLLEKKLNKLKEQKKGLMQQLLTGKTRIINHHKFE